MPTMMIHAPAAQQAVDDAVVGQRAQALEGARAAAARHRGAATRDRAGRPGRVPGAAGRRRRRGAGPARGARRCARAGAAVAGLTARLRSSLRAARRRADFERGLPSTSPGVGTTERRKISSASGVRPQPQTGRSGGQMQPWARSARKRLTRRSSSEWKAMAASRPCSASSSHASGSAASSWPSSSLTAIRMPWNVRLAGCPPANRAGAGIAAVIASTSSKVVVRGARGGRSSRAIRSA